MRSVAVAALLDSYDGYEPFLDSCRAARARLVPITLADGYPKARHVTEVETIVRQLMHRWNLDRVPDVAGPMYVDFRGRVRRLDTPIGSLTHRMFSPILALPFEGIPAEPSVTHAGIIWTWAISAGESMRGFRQRVMSAAGFSHPRRMPQPLRAQFDGLATQARALEWLVVDPPTTLDQQIDWLFKRLCPQPDQVMGWAAIRKPDQFDYATVRRTVTGLAFQMGIVLPPLRRGRPRTRS